MPKYVRKKGSDTWHYCVNCSSFPTGDDIEVSEKRPPYGEICNQCQAKANEGSCVEYKQARQSKKGKVDSRFNKLFHISKEAFKTRAMIPWLPVFDENGVCHYFLDTGKDVFDLPGKPAQGVYFSKKMESKDDVYSMFIDFLYQRGLIKGKGTMADLNKLHTKIQSVKDDVHILAASLGKIQLWFRLLREDYLENLQISWLVWSEVEYIFTVCKSFFDLLQKIAKMLWERIDLTNPNLEKKELNSRFSRMVLRGEEQAIMKPEEIQDKYGLSPQLADFYYKTAGFFKQLRDFRDKVIHYGTPPEIVFIFKDKGFAVPSMAPDRKTSSPFAVFDVWKEETFLPNELAPLRPVVCFVIHETLKAIEEFVVALSKDIKFPNEIAPGYRVFLRGPYIHKLYELIDSIDKKVWEIDWQEEEETEK